MRFQRFASGAAAVGIIVAGSVVLGVAAPANAVVEPLSSYMLTVPPSVYSTSAGYTPVESLAYMNLARAGSDPDKPPVAPVAPSKGFIKGGLQGVAIYAGVSALMSAGGTLGWLFPSPDAIQGDIDAAGGDMGEAFMCSDPPSDWLGDLLQGMNDFVAGLLGVDCDTMRADLEKDPAYEPVRASPAATYPFTISSGAGSLTFGEPYWSSLTYVVSGVTRQEGWVLPLTTNGTPGNMWARGQLISASGPVAGSLGAVLLSATSGSGGGLNLTAGTCSTTRCIVLDRLYEAATGISGGQTGAPSSWAPTGNYIASIKNVESWDGTPLTSVELLPYVNPLTGSYTPPELVPQVLVTTLETSDGNVYRCKTREFLETDSVIPPSCTPEVPWDEVVVSSLTEMIPATDYPTYVPGSNPAREVQRTDATPEYVNWRNAFAACAATVCHMDLRNAQGSCFDQGDACLDWATDPNRAGSYTCTYGGQTIALSECEAAYPNVFDQTKRDEGLAYPRPEGLPSGIPTSTSPSPAITPGSGYVNPENSWNCLPTGWGLANPIEWVFTPVRCALTWAFVPRQTQIQATVAQITTTFNGSMVGQLSGVVAALIDSIPDDGGCGGIPFSYSMFGQTQVDTDLLAACGGDDLAPTAAVTKTIMTGSAIVAAVLACTRYLATIFGFVGYGSRAGTGKGDA